MDATIRPFRPEDRPDVVRIFLSTVALGRPLPFHDPVLLASYAGLCLDWYLGPGREDAAVVETAEGVRGYLLVCTDQYAYNQWVRSRAPKWAADAIARVVSGRTVGPAARFVRLRVADGWRTWRLDHPAPMPAHAHFNLDPEIRATNTGHRLALRVDERVRELGMRGWYGELNAPKGRELRAIEAAGARVVYRMPNRTLSWLAGRPVERLTIVRPLSSATRTVRERADLGPPRPCEPAAFGAPIAATSGV